MIAAIRIKCPSKCILIVKTDLDAAHRRVHANAKIASTFIPIVEKPAFLCLRLPFVTIPTPEEYITISEAEIDFGNDLLADTSWYATILQSPH